MIEEKEKIYEIKIENQAYPEKLRHIYKPPKRLFVIGNLPREDKISLAVVGARDCSYYGKETALYFCKELSKYGIQIISGLARGIDGYAHQGALESEMPTFGILGCGIDICYPKENSSLYKKMCKSGGILSEYPEGTPPLAGYFPMRNRIISGLADGIFVIEAREKSGSLITVEYGLEQGKDIFVLPGRINDNLSKGCNGLLKAGAIPITEPLDLLNYYGIESSSNTMENKKNNKCLEMGEEMVYSRLCLVPKHVNQIVCESCMPLYAVMESLISLEEKGYIKQVLKNYYIKLLE
ncbi:MAG: DNA-processing protein DprA [Acetivibrio sp.]